MMENPIKQSRKCLCQEGKIQRSLVRSLVGGLVSALYKRQHGHYPASDIPGRTHTWLLNLMTECASDTHEGTGKAMFESVAQSMRSLTA
uniref:Uncharacterized protein n=1 Tax=Salmonella sp. TaxID=599 RepID=A0A482ETK6_SALSP|nr:hypothetical protein NNIBIDOC_00232 [Salmonella sp.]